MLFEDFVKELILYKIPIEQEKKSLGTFFTYYSDKFRVNGNLYSLSFNSIGYNGSKRISQVYDISRGRFLNAEQFIKELTINTFRFGLNEGKITVTLVYNIEGRSKISLKQGTRSGLSKLYYSVKVPRENTEINEKIRLAILNRKWDNSILSCLSPQILSAFSIYSNPA